MEADTSWADVAMQLIVVLGPGLAGLLVALAFWVRSRASAKERAVLAEAIHSHGPDAEAAAMGLAAKHKVTKGVTTALSRAKLEKLGRGPGLPPGDSPG